MVSRPLSLANCWSIVVPVHPESSKANMLHASPAGVWMFTLTSNAFWDLFLCMNLGFCWSSRSVNCASKSVISLSCWISLGETSFVRESCTKNHTCLRDLIRSFWSTTFLIHWDVHGSTMFIQFLGEVLDVSTFSGRIVLPLDNSAEFGLSTLLERIIVGAEDDSVHCFFSLFSIVILGGSGNPVDSISDFLSLRCSSASSFISGILITSMGSMLYLL